MVLLYTWLLPRASCSCIIDEALMLISLGCVYQKAQTVPELLFTHFCGVAQLPPAPSALRREERSAPGPLPAVLSAMDTQGVGAIAMAQ